MRTMSGFKCYRCGNTFFSIVSDQSLLAARLFLEEAEKRRNVRDNLCVDCQDKKYRKFLRER